jgi:single-stranded-DNA-specific exonuclease
LTRASEPPPAISVFDPDFHEGVVGIVASRIKDKLHRPTFVFAASSAPGKEHELKGSGRSIPGFHLRDALDLVAKRHPGVLLQIWRPRHGGGLHHGRRPFDTFEQALAQVAQEWLDAATLTRRIETDGPLAPEYCRADMVDTLHREVWGQGFAPPTFSEEVQVLSQRLVGEAKPPVAQAACHQGNPVDAIWFGRTEPLPARVLLAFRLDVNEWKGERKVQFLVEGAQVRVYVTDHAGTAQPTAGAQGSVTLLSGKQKATIPLAPGGDNVLQGTGSYVLAPNLKAVVSITLPGQAALQARFTPLAKPSATHTGHTAH